MNLIENQEGTIEERALEKLRQYNLFQANKDIEILCEYPGTRVDPVYDTKCPDRRLTEAQFEKILKADFETGYNENDPGDKMDFANKLPPKCKAEWIRDMKSEQL